MQQGVLVEFGLHITTVAARSTLKSTARTLFLFHSHDEGLVIKVDVEGFVAAANDCLNKSVLKRPRNSYHGPCRVVGDLIPGHLVFFWQSLSSSPRWPGYQNLDSLFRAIDSSLMGWV